MDTCEVCGNQYDKCFTVHIMNTSHTFDCFECAINLLAPSCGHCQCKIIGHGVEEEGHIYCCAHCGKQEGAKALRDRA